LKIDREKNQVSRRNLVLLRSANEQTRMVSLASLAFDLCRRLFFGVDDFRNRNALAAEFARACARA
jgi:hypothetical protein